MSKKKPKKKVIDVLGRMPKKTEGQLNVYYHVAENSGVGFYRQYLPAKVLRDLDIQNATISDFRFGKGDHALMDMDTLFEVAMWADLIVVGRHDKGDYYAQWGGIREFFNMPIVMDTDDNVQHVRPSNPGYTGYYPGSDALMWNKHAVGKVFDAITVSTENLVEVYKEDNPKIYHLPNNIDVKEWEKHPIKKFDDGKIRVGFIGSSAHTEGIRIIKPPLKRILEKHSNVILFMTHVYRSHFEDWPKELKDRIEWIPWLELETWPKELRALGLDISLAPLADNMFNRGKSNLRWMEYSACKWATVASDVEPYRCINNGKDGILVKERNEWYEAIDSLVKDEKLRYNIGENAFKRISKDFDIRNNCKKWDAVYKEIHKKYHDFFGKKKVFKKVKKGKYKQLA